MAFIFINCVLIAILINLVQSDCNHIPYARENLKFEIFKKGFRVLLVHRPGIQQFRFHGKINENISCLEDGEFPQRVNEKCGNYWVFEEHQFELKIGDRISYWAFFMKNQFGFNIGDQSFIVKEISDWKPLNCNQNPSCEEIINENPDETPFKQPQQEKILSKVEKSVCCQLYLNVSYRIVELAEENIKLQNENKIQAELVQRDDYNARTLKIFGQYSSKIYSTAKSFVQSLIEDKLGLKDVKVVEAKTIPQDGVIFKVENSKDKVKVILAAQKGLDGSNYEITW